MLESFLRSQSFFRVKSLITECWSKKEVTARRPRTMLRIAYQSLVEEINSFYRGLRKQRGEWAPLADGQRSDVVARAAGCDAVELL